MSDMHFPTAYFGPEEIEIVCGDKTEGWAGIRFEDEERVRDVHLGQLSAEEPQTDIYEAIETANTIYHVDFKEHLPLRVRLPGDSVVIETAHTVRLIDFDVWRAEEESEDTYGFVQTMLKVMRYIDTAHTQPRRFLFQHQAAIEEYR